MQNRPYLVWDAERGVFIVPFHEPPRDAPPPQTFGWQPRPAPRVNLDLVFVVTVIALILAAPVIAWVLS